MLPPSAPPGSAFCNELPMNARRGGVFLQHRDERFEVTRTMTKCLGIVRVHRCWNTLPRDKPMKSKERGRRCHTGRKLEVDSTCTSAGKRLYVGPVRVPGGAGTKGPAIVDADNEKCLSICYSFWFSVMVPHGQTLPSTVTFYKVNIGK